MNTRHLQAYTLVFIALLGSVILFSHSAPTTTTAPGGAYNDLINLFREFRAFVQPRYIDGVPDYTPLAVAAQKTKLPEFRQRLAAIDPAGWPVSERVDYELVRAEMKGLDFELRILRPWARIPTFYAVLQTSEPDVPRREGPEIPSVLNLWTYRFPLDDRGKADIRAKLAAVPGVLAQAKANLAEGTKDLWLMGIRQKDEEAADLAGLAARLRKTDPDLVPLVDRARTAVDGFRGWLQRKLPQLTGTSGIGVAEFDWYQRNVHLVPYSWAEQVSLVQREYDRAMAFLKLEEHRNRLLPPLAPPATDDELARRARVEVAYFMDFLRTRDIFTVPDYMRLAEEPGHLVPAERRDFFTQVQYHDFLPLLCHSLHWLEKQREAHNTHPVRGVPLLYNIWDSRAEGAATAFEETMLQAGLFDGNPRARELVYILLAFRAVRAMCDLKLHSGEWTLEEAVRYAVAATPRGWCRHDSPTIWGDLALYLAQPGYGTSYVIGKIQFERLMADRTVQLGEKFTLKAFLDDLFARGLIPTSLLRWEMTGLDGEVRELLK